MKINISGYDVECTPEELDTFLRVKDQNNQFPKQVTQWETGTPYWSILPPNTITCDEYKINTTITTSSTAEEFAENALKILNSKGVRVGTLR